MYALSTAQTKTVKAIGVATEHGGYASKEYLTGMLRDALFDVVDFGDIHLKLDEVAALEGAEARTP